MHMIPTACYAFELTESIDVMPAHVMCPYRLKIASSCLFARRDWGVLFLSSRVTARNELSEAISRNVA